MSNDGEPIRETRQSIHVITIAVSNDDVRDRFWCQLGDFGNELLGRIPGSFRVHDDHTLLSNNYPGISAAPSNPVNCALPQSMNGHGLRLLWLRRLLRHGNSTQTHKRRNYQGQLPPIARAPRLRLTGCEGSLLFVIAVLFHALSLPAGREVADFLSRNRRIPKMPIPACSLVAR